MQPVQGAASGAVDGGGDARVLNKPLSAEEQDANIAAFMRAHGMAAQARMNPAQYAKDVLKNDRLAQEMTEAANPAMIPQNYVPRIIELLRPRAVIRQMGPTMIPLINGNATMPKLTAGAAANYVTAEGNNAVPSTPTTGR